MALQVLFWISKSNNHIHSNKCPGKLQLIGSMKLTFLRQNVGKYNKILVP